MNTMEQTKVVFRKYRNGEIIALFPQTGDRYNYEVMSYLHIGQHGGADYTGVIRQTKPANANEYADLLAELKYIGYCNIRVCKRAKVEYN